MTKVGNRPRGDRSSFFLEDRERRRTPPYPSGSCYAQRLVEKGIADCIIPVAECGLSGALRQLFKIHTLIVIVSHTNSLTFNTVRSCALTMRT